MTVVHRYLPNGMEVYLESSDFAPLANVQVWVRTGSIDEEEHEAGVAHVLEHMLFKGTEKCPVSGQIASLIETEGGDINAYTTFDHTVYYFTGPASFAIKGAELLHDVVSSSLLDATELSRELEVVIEEIKRGRDNPSQVLGHNLFGKLYPGMRMGRPVIGFEEIVKGFTRETVNGFYKKWYAPNNMTFIAVGNFDTAEFYAQLLEWSKDFAPVSLPERVRPLQIPAHNLSPSHTLSLSHTPFSPSVVVARGAYQEVRAQLTVTSPALEHPETPIWEMFTSVLGHGDSSRLSRVVRDDLQLATSIDTSLFTPQYPDGFCAIGIYARAQTALDALVTSLSEIALLANQGPGTEEMTRVLNAVKAERIYSRESMEGIARSAGMALQTSRKLNFETEFLENLTRVTAAQVKECAHTFLKRVAAGQFVISAAFAREALPELTEVEFGTRIQEAAKACLEGKDIAPSANSSSHSTSVEPAFIHTSVSNPGVLSRRYELSAQSQLRVNYRNTSRLPVASSVAVWQGGAALEPANKPGMSTLLAQMLTRGTRKQSYKSFVAELEDYAASIGAFSSKDVFGIRMDSLSEHAPRVLDMTLECLFRPSFESEEWQRVVNETKDVLTAQKDSPSARLSRISGPLLFGNDVYSRPGLGTAESLELISLNDVRALWEQMLTRPRYVFSLAGEVAVDGFSQKIARALKEHLGSVNQKSELDRSPQHAEKYAENAAQPRAPQQSDHRVGFDEFEREQAHVTLGFRALTLSDPRRTALELAANILGGQGGRLFMDLRDKRSLAYSVGASQNPQLRAGVFNTYIGTASHKVEEAIEGLKMHLERLACEPPTQEELIRAQRSVMGTQAIDSQHTHYQASQLAMSDVYGLGFDNFLRFAERVNQVTAEQIQQIMRELLVQNPPVIAIVGPKGTHVPAPDSSVLTWKL